MVPTRIALVDPCPLTRSGLRLVLEDDPGLRVVLEAAGAGDLPAGLDGTPADAVVCVGTGAQRAYPALVQLRDALAQRPGAPRLALVTRINNPTLLRLLAADRFDAMAHLRDQPECIREAVHASIAGVRYYGRRAIAEAYGIDCASIPPPRESLSWREWAVAARIAGGASGREIARSLDCSAQTVAAHKRAAFVKLGARNDAEFHLFVRDAGIEAALGRPQPRRRTPRRRAAPASEEE